MKQLILIVALLGALTACKKETTSYVQENSIASSCKFFRIGEVDKDGTMDYSKVVWKNMNNSTQLNNGSKRYNEPEPQHWKNWQTDFRLWWCKQIQDAYDYYPGWYCSVCNEMSVCRTTPVVWGDLGFDGSTLYWNILTELEVDHYVIEGSVDGFNYTTLKDNIPSHGIGKYSYILK
jgi:hypothetical protein